HNASAGPVSVAGWRLTSAVEYTFPPNTTIAAGGYLIVAENPAAIQTKFGKTAIGPWIGNLSSKGEVIRLRNASDTVVSEVDYKVGFPWPTASDGDGTSIELINPQLDEGSGGNWRAATLPSLTATNDVASPGAQNLKFAANAPPAVRTVDHSPKQPSSSDPIVVTARVTDVNGVASVQLLYQIVAPGNFIPATLPRTISGGQFSSTALPLSPNAAFESAANWTTIAMNDDGVGADEQGGDGFYTATIPAQAHRALVRYRILAADNSGASIRVPHADDPSLNFACFVYNGVPAYQGTPGATLAALPTYHFLTRSADYIQCIAYNSANQLAGNTPSWTFENWEAAFVCDGVVYDHVAYRLHGANGRYSASGVQGAAATSKRAFKFVFNKGAYFQGRDNEGNDYPTSWKTMVTENCWENRATYTFSLNEAVNLYIWNVLGVPSPLGNFAHFRTIKQSAEQPDAWRGDFWGLMFVHEDYDSQFLDAHDLPAGNLYKLTRDNISGVSQQRYQAPLAVKNGSDHDELLNNLKGTSSPAYITARVNLDLWARYHAFSEAIRHYDYWPNGDNNAAYYFYPDYNAANGNKGVLWWLPNDVDATWGPTWNNGRDLVHN
ncbi:MAG: CotH kinase family protein, partial [Verrucomicrobiota bacterium]